MPLLWEALQRTDSRAALHVWTDDRYVPAAWRQVVADAEAAAAGLRRLGVRSGTRVACVLTNTAAAVRGLLGIWLAGGTVASLPLPSRGMSLEEYGEHIEVVLAGLGAELLVVDQQLEPLVPPGVRAHARIACWEKLEESGRGGPFDGSPPGADEVAFIQYSSGSTGEPKGCMLTSGAISRQLELIHGMLGAEPGAERVVSWLPLSHDMGIFGCLLYSLAYDQELALSPPERFVLSPRTWFRDLVDFRVTMTAGTSTGLHVATRAHARHRLAGDLHLKVCVLGAERIEVGALERAVECFGDNGLTMKAFMPAYGMAEATLAVTATPWDAAPKSIVLDAERLAEQRIVEVAPDDPKGTRIISTGPPCEGVTVDTAEPDRLSEILVSSPCLARGYVADEARTRQRFVDGRFHSGDLGVLRDGELYVVGRTDDLLSVGGRKVYAREIEAALDTVDAVRKGCAVVIDLPSGDGGTELVLAVELRRADADHDAFAAHAAAIARRKSGAALARCVFFKPNTLPRTPSGKVQRFRIRMLLTRRALTPVASVELG